MKTINIQRKWLYLLLVLPFFIFQSCTKKKNESPLEKTAKEPVVYTGHRTPDKYFYDGKLPHAVGVHLYQVVRANRSHSPVNGKVGWTYNHQPFLAYWNGQFYLQYLSDLVQEHTPPGRTLLVTSKDGRHWSKPEIVFPEYTLPEINYKNVHIPAGMKSVMHQRMGFYVAPNGRLLTSAFYSYCATPSSSPNAGTGLGRVVREVYKNGTFGPIYFIRYNRSVGWNEKTVPHYPFYKTSKDKGFLTACDSLLSNKLITLQWWEEDRQKDGFFVINPGDVKNAAYFSQSVVTSAGAGKAFNFYHISDGTIVGLWKNQYSALSSDNGKTWSKIVKNKTLMTDGAKTWGQKTDDGKYAIVHNQSATRRNRFPMTVMTSTDGHIFNNLLCLNGEVPPKRYQGLHKNTGPQYYRGIIEGNGNPPGKDMWIVYSVNKEDIWIANIHVPIIGKVNKDANQNFDNVKCESDLKFWNLYNTQLAQATIIKDPKNHGNKYMMLKDEDPYDYAKAERIFPKRKKGSVEFRINPFRIAQGHALSIEIQDQHGNRPMRLRFDKDWLSMNISMISAPKPVKIKTNKLYNVTINFDCEKQSYELKFDGKGIEKDIPFAVKVKSLSRIVFRTGPYRGYVDPAVAEKGMDKPAGLNTEDLPGASKKAPTCIYLIDDLKTKGV